MVNPEEQSAAQQQPQEAAQNVRSEFLDKMSEIPTVNTVKEYSSAVYNLVKGYNKFTDAALTAAEKTALYLAVTAKPFLEKVEPQAKAIDQAALKSLEAIEQKAPYIMKPTVELVEDARQLVSSTVSDVKNFGIDKVHTVLDRTENLVDRILPPAFGNGASEASNESSSVSERANELTNKIGLRLYGHSIKPFMYIYYLSDVSASKLSYSIQLIIQMKQSATNKSVQEYIDDVKLKAFWIWDELRKENPADTTDAETSLEQRALSYARRMTSILVHAYNSLPLSSLPASYQESAQSAQKLAMDLFTQLDQNTNASEITLSWLHSIRQKVAALEGLIQSLKSQEEELEMDEIAPTDNPQQ